MKKKYFVLFFFILMPLYIFIGNPIVLPQAFISEFKFDENSKWILEINFRFSEPYLKHKYDSICIGTLNGFSRMNLDNIKDSTYLFVITADSLKIPLEVNNDGDNIKLYSYLDEQYYTEPLIDLLLFGNYPGSVIDSLRNGYSVARIAYDIFAKDKSPTIGFENDTVGTCGTLRGKIYDKNNELVHSGNFILDNLIYIDNNGIFTTSVYSRKALFTGLSNNYKPGQYQWARIDSIKLNVNPDSLYENDIHILTDLIVGIDEQKFGYVDEISVTNFPSPFNSVTNFAIKLPLELQNEVKQINIYNVTGELVSYINFENEEQVSWGATDIHGNPVSTGVYYYQLVIEHKSYKTGKMILLK